MNGVYIALGCALAAVSLVSVVFQVGRKVGRVEEHLSAQDDELAELHNKLDKLQP